MDSFLKKFFPSVYRKEKADESTNQYCKFDSLTLTLFTSSLYLAALMSSIVASTVTRKLGRKLSMLLGGVLFCAGALINGFAQAVWMLIVGRILLGFGIGFANQVCTESLCMKERFSFFWFLSRDSQFLDIPFLLFSLQVVRTEQKWCFQKSQHGIFWVFVLLLRDF